MKLLFNTQKTYNQLFEETGLYKLDFLNAFSKLRKTKLIEKSPECSINNEDRAKSEIEIARELVGKPAKSKENLFYLTKAGEQRLAFYEYKYRLFEIFGYDEFYLSDMISIVEEQKYFGKPPKRC